MANLLALVALVSVADASEAVATALAPAAMAAASFGVGILASGEAAGAPSVTFADFSDVGAPTTGVAGAVALAAAGSAGAAAAAAGSAGAAAAAAGSAGAAGAAAFGSAGAAASAAKSPASGVLILFGASGASGSSSSPSYFLVVGIGLVCSNIFKYPLTSSSPGTTLWNPLENFSGSSVEATKYPFDPIFSTSINLLTSELNLISFWSTNLTPKFISAP